jgi:hypothetical protein
MPLIFLKISALNGEALMNQEAAIMGFQTLESMGCCAGVSKASLTGALPKTLFDRHETVAAVLCFLKIRLSVNRVLRPIAPMFAASACKLGRDMEFCVG